MSIINKIIVAIGLKRPWPQSLPPTPTAQEREALTQIAKAGK